MKTRRNFLITSVCSLVLLATVTGLTVMSTQSEARNPATTRVQLKGLYAAETGLTEATRWFNESYSLPEAGLVDSTPATPVGLTDVAGQTFEASVSLMDGSPIVLNAADGGTSTTHPPMYTSVSNTRIANLTTSFHASMGNQTVPLGFGGYGSYAVMATLVRYAPEVWRIDAIGKFGGKSEAVSVRIEKLPLSPFIHSAFTFASTAEIRDSHILDGRDHDMDGGIIAGGDGLPGIAVLDAHDYPATPAAALGLDPAYQSYLDGRATTTIPCVIKGLAVIDRSFPAGSGANGCQYSGTGVLILHNPRYDPRYFDPADPLYASRTSPAEGQTAAQYRADSLNQPRRFNYGARNIFKGIIVADSIDKAGISADAEILGAIISLDRVNGFSATGAANVAYSTAAIRNALNSMPYARQPGTFRHLAQ